MYNCQYYEYLYYSLICVIKVRKDIGGVERTPSIVVVYFGKENNRDKLFRVKFGGLQEIREGLMRSAIQLTQRIMES